MASMMSRAPVGDFTPIPATMSVFDNKEDILQIAADGVTMRSWLLKRQPGGLRRWQKRLLLLDAAGNACPADCFAYTDNPNCRLDTMRSVKLSTVRAVTTSQPIDRGNLPSLTAAPMLSKGLYFQIVCQELVTDASPKSPLASMTALLPRLQHASFDSDHARVFEFYAENEEVGRTWLLALKMAAGLQPPPLPINETSDSQTDWPTTGNGADRFDAVLETDEEDSDAVAQKQLASNVPPRRRTVVKCKFASTIQTRRNFWHGRKVVKMQLSAEFRSRTIIRRQGSPYVDTLPEADAPVIANCSLPAAATAWSDVVTQEGSIAASQIETANTKAGARPPNTAGYGIPLALLRSSIAETPQVINHSADLEERFIIKYSELNFGKELARGNFGVVYRGEYTANDCVIKVHVDDSSNTYDAVMREAKLMSQLRPHASICAFYGVCVEPNYPLCIVLEYVAGGNLGSLLLQKRRIISGRDVVSMSRDLAAGMTVLHRAEVLHLDLAARNLLVLRHEEPLKLRICDFGLSKTLIDGKNSVSAERCQIPWRWTDPSVVQSRAFQKQTDVWAFGICLWEMLSRRRPYDHLQTKDVLPYVLQGGRLPSPDVDRKLPVHASDATVKTLYQLMLECWNDDLAARPDFQTISQRLLKMLQVSDVELNGDPISPTTISAEEVALSTLQLDATTPDLAPSEPASFLGGAPSIADYARFPDLADHSANLTVNPAAPASSAGADIVPDADCEADDDDGEGQYTLVYESRSSEYRKIPEPAEGVP